MREMAIILLLLVLLCLSGCVSEEGFVFSENVTESPTYQGHNYTNLEDIDSIENLPDGFGWVGANPSTVSSNHFEVIRGFSNVSTNITFFIQGEAQLASGSINEIDFENDKAYSKGNSIATDRELYISENKKYVMRNFTENNSVYEVSNFTSDRFGFLGQSDVNLVFDSFNMEIQGKKDDIFIYNITGLGNEKYFMGFNNSEINNTKGYIIVNKRGFIREIELKSDIKGEAVQVSENATIEKQVYFHYKVYDVGDTVVSEPDWYSKLKNEYGSSKWFNDDDVVT